MFACPTKIGLLSSVDFKGTFFFWSLCTRTCAFEIRRINEEGRCVQKGPNSLSLFLFSTSWFSPSLLRFVLFSRSKPGLTWSNLNRLASASLPLRIPTAVLMAGKKRWFHIEISILTRALWWWWMTISQEDRSGCRCFLIGESEAVKRSTADLICAGHSGSWVAELDHPGHCGHR